MKNIAIKNDNVGGNSTVHNWPLVRNQLDAHPQFQDRFRKYSN